MARSTEELVTSVEQEFQNYPTKKMQMCFWHFSQCIKALWQWTVAAVSIFSMVEKLGWPIHKNCISTSPAMMIPTKMRFNIMKKISISAIYFAGPVAGWYIHIL